MRTFEQGLTSRTALWVSVGREFWVEGIAGAKSGAGMYMV